MHGLGAPHQELLSVVKVLYIKKYYLILACVMKYVLSRQNLKELCEFLFVSKKYPAKSGEQMHLGFVQNLCIPSLEMAHWSAAFV